ncbi:hypothetical protein H2201_002345 [Coniosporium apollinis]|uniref:Uncharacterized protein n=1 Tax=Coniosporium apollinis TaxID=61459 RepID=A0ABQ9P2C3_9PEZI|nr:hypothetical protein H2201_002345 [Coniosporium apollinis]
MPNAATSENMSMADDSDSSEDEFTDDAGLSSRASTGSNTGSQQMGELNDAEDSNFWSLPFVPPSRFAVPVAPMLPVDKDNPVPGEGIDQMDATFMEEDYMDLMATPMQTMSTANAFEFFPQSDPSHNSVATHSTTAPTPDQQRAMPPLFHSNSLPNPDLGTSMPPPPPHSNSLPNIPTRLPSARQPNTSTLVSRTTLELENVPQEALSRVMDILFQARTRVRMETTHQDSSPRNTPGG